jgi:hypothetical protein
VLVAALSAIRPGAAQAPKLENEVVFASYGGSFEAFMRRDVMPGFEKATGVKVKLVVGNALGNSATQNSSTILLYLAIVGCCDPVASGGAHQRR